MREHRKPCHLRDRRRFFRHGRRGNRTASTKHRARWPAHSLRALRPRAQVHVHVARDAGLHAHGADDWAPLPSAAGRLIVSSWATRRTPGGSLPTVAARQPMTRAVASSSCSRPYWTCTAHSIPTAPKHGLAGYGAHTLRRPTTSRSTSSGTTSACGRLHPRAFFENWARAPSGLFAAPHSTVRPRNHAEEAAALVGPVRHEGLGSGGMRWATC